MNELFKKFDEARREIPDSKVILPGSKEEVLFHPYDTLDQKSMLKALEKRDFELLNDVFDSVLKKNVVSPENFDPQELLVKDREYLLIEFRRNSIHEEFKYSWECEHVVGTDKNDKPIKCGSKNELVMNLANLTYTKLENMDKLTKEFDVSDRKDVTIYLGLAKRRDEKEILKYTRVHSRDMKDGERSRAEIFYATLASLIQKVKIGEEIYEGKKLKFEDKLQLVGKLNLEDRNIIQNFISDIDDYGFDLEVKNQVCPKCRNMTDVKVEWITFFAM